MHAHSPVVASVARVLIRALPRARRPAFVYTEHNRWPSYKTETRIANAATFGLDDADFAVSNDVRSVDHIPVPCEGRGRRPRRRRRLGARRSSRSATTCAPSSGSCPASPRGHGGEPPPRQELPRPPRRRSPRRRSRRSRSASPPPARASSRRRSADCTPAAASVNVSRCSATATTPPELIAAADLFVLASHHEGLPGDGDGGAHPRGAGRRAGGRRAPRSGRRAARTASSSSPDSPDGAGRRASASGRAGRHAHAELATTRADRRPVLVAPPPSRGSTLAYRDAVGPLTHHDREPRPARRRRQATARSDSADVRPPSPRSPRPAPRTPPARSWMTTSGATGCGRPTRPQPASGRSTSTPRQAMPPTTDPARP